MFLIYNMLKIKQIIKINQRLLPIFIIRRGQILPIVKMIQNTRKRRNKNQIINLISSQEQSNNHQKTSEKNQIIIEVKQEQQKQKKNIILVENQNDAQLVFQDFCPNLQIKSKKCSQAVTNHYQSKTMNQKQQKGAMISEQEESYEIPKLSFKPQENQNQFVSQVVEPQAMKEEPINTFTTGMVQQKRKISYSLQEFESIINRDMKEKLKNKQKKALNHKFKQEEQQSCREQLFRKYKDIDKLSKKKQIKKQEIKKLAFKVQVKQNIKQQKIKEKQEKNLLLQKQKQERKLKRQKIQIASLKDVNKQKNQKSPKETISKIQQKQLKDVQEINQVKVHQNKEVKYPSYIPFYIKINPVPFPFKVKKIVSTKLVKNLLQNQDTNNMSPEQILKRDRLKNIVYTTELKSGQMKQFTHEQMVNLNKDVIFDYFQEKIAWSNHQKNN